MLDPIRKNESDVEGYLLRVVDELNLQIGTLESGVRTLTEKLTACESRIEVLENGAA